MDKAFEAGINFFDTAEMYSTCPIREETADYEVEIANVMELVKAQKEYH